MNDEITHEQCNDKISQSSLSKKHLYQSISKHYGQSPLQISSTISIHISDRTSASSRLYEPMRQEAEDTVLPKLMAFFETGQNC